MYFLILYLSLSRLALWIERIAVNIEIVGLSLTSYNMLIIIFFFIFIINHDLRDFAWLTCKNICNKIHFKALYLLRTVMSTNKSLKHLKSNDKLLIANVLNYF